MLRPGHDSTSDHLPSHDAVGIRKQIDLRQVGQTTVVRHGCLSAGAEVDERDGAHIVDSQYPRVQQGYITCCERQRL